MEVLRTTAEDPFFVGTINCSDMPHHLFKLEDACIFFCHSGEARIEIDLLEYDIMPNTQIIFLPNSIINYSYASPDLSISYITFSNAFFQEATVRLDPSFFHFLKENPVVTLPVERTRTINGLIIALEDLYRIKKTVSDCKSFATTYKVSFWTFMIKHTASSSRTARKESAGRKNCSNGSSN